MRPTGRVGVYVHVPFCSRHCPYCDFTVAVVSRIPHAAYADALLNEWDDRREEIEGRALRTVYFGGGTPGLWDPSELGRVLAALRGDAELDEVTVEMNPEHTTPAQLDALLDAGVTRLSFGVQSFDDATLARLGRAHDGARAVRALRDAAAAGFEHLSVDVIFAVPGDRARRAVEDVERAATLPGVDHVSAYELTFEPSTSFDRRRRIGELEPVDDDAAVDAQAELEVALERAGFERYEVSSYARPGGRAVHNHAYWAGDEYVGLGVGAHSMAVAPHGQHVVRRANDRSLRRYLESRGRTAPELERVPADVHARELVMTAMRTTDGLDEAALEHRLRGCPPPGPLLRRWEGLGWVSRSGTRWRPTAAGLRHADAMAADLFAG